MVCRAIKEALRPPAGKAAKWEDPVAKRAKLGAPTGDIKAMLAQTERGRQ